MTAKCPRKVERAFYKRVFYEKGERVIVETLLPGTSEVVNVKTGEIEAFLVDVENPYRDLETDCPIFEALVVYLEDGNGFSLWRKNTYSMRKV